MIYQMSDPDNDNNKLSNIQKWWMSILVGVLYIIFASGPAFAISNDLLRPICFQTFYGTGGPTLAGLLLHATMITIIVRLAIENINL